ncbi:CheR family methyltransferase [Noviherbaspirillum malthae]|uniref:CheR family methyltransferase n=1 Tax=Noviherbaspirillum malthae TaxID=1260987 RepID=UPI00188F7DA7|nr:CheR family methyltransferase [Noviherbaspirillum malthae]
MNDSNQAAASSTPSGTEGSPQSHLRFPVVGIGASAGGLPALLTLLEQLPASPGMAFVVVMHLPADQRSGLDRILQKATAMPVVQLQHTLPILPDHVYVIPPNRSIRMHDSHLVLDEMERRDGQHIAIDIFFRTLAEAHKEHAVAVVLSGMGSDGSLGATRIKEQGGVAIAQHPADAEHDSMPLAAIATGAVDFIVTAADIPAKLVSLWDNAKAIQLPPAKEEDAPLTAGKDLRPESEQALQDVIGMLRNHTGHDFRSYKRATILRRIERRMQVREVPDMQSYRGVLENDPPEHNALLKDLLIGVTNFFRDREAFEALERQILPQIFQDKPLDGEVRAWVAACSTGEEAYSLAMLMNEHASALPRPPKFQIFASDIDERGIAAARAGLYPASIAADVAPERLAAYFAKEDGRYRIRKTVRDRVLFAAHNVLRDPPFSRLDLITCRNLMIYLNREMQMHVLEMFHFALNPGGFLFLGSSESADVMPNLFAPVDKANRIYQAKPLARTSRYLPKPMANMPSRMVEPEAAYVPARRQFSYAEIHQQALLQYAEASILVNTDSDIVHLSDRAGRYLRHVGGEPSRSIISLILPELRLELRSALFQAIKSGRPVETRRIPVEQDGQTRHVAMTVRPFRNDEAGADLALILIEESSEGVGGAAIHEFRQDAVLAQLDEELQRTKEQLQQTIEQAEASSEDMRASNEELQATIEELRSATEELETSKEELQSINEELITVNAELKSKVEETSKANDDLSNLIASADIATIFVDRSMHIKRYTPRVAELFNIIPSDVGRSLLDITHKLNYPELAADAATTFDTLRPLEREVRSTSGHTFIARVRPYRTVEDRIDGAVMTFFDISRHREAEEQLRRNAAQQAFMLRLSDTLRSLGDTPLIQREASRVLREHLGAKLVVFWEAVSEDELALAGCSYAPGTAGFSSRLRLSDHDPGVGAAYRMGQIVCLEDAAREPSLTDAQRAAFAAEGTGGWIGVPLMKGGKLSALLGAAYPAPHKWSQAEIALVQEVAERTFAAMERAQAEAARQASEDALRESEARFRMLVEGFAQAVWETDAAGRLIGDSPGWRAYTGQSLEDGLAKGWLDTVHPEDRGEALRQWEDAVGTGRLLNARVRLRTADDGWRMTNVLATPLVDADGSVRKWIGVNIDAEGRSGT